MVEQSDLEHVVLPEQKAELGHEAVLPVEVEAEVRVAPAAFEAWKHPEFFEQEMTI